MLRLSIAHRSQYPRRSRGSGQRSGRRKVKRLTGKNCFHVEALRPQTEALGGGKDLRLVLEQNRRMSLGTTRGYAPPLKRLSTPR